MRALAYAALAALLIGPCATGALAETVDAKAFSCQELTQSMQSDDENDQYGASVILYWLHGYLTPEERGTVVDFDLMMGSFEKVVDYCAKNPNIGIMTASEKFMGENEDEAGKGALDLSIVKCESVVNSSEDDAQGIGQILMWLAGYHASYNEDTVIDFAKFQKDTRSIGAYCAKNAQVGFFTASEKFMGSTE